MITFDLVPEAEKFFRKEALVWLNRYDGFKWIYKRRICEDPESRFYNIFDIKELLSITKVVSADEVVVCYQVSSALNLQYKTVKISDIYLENPKRDIVLKLKSLKLCP